MLKRQKNSQKDLFKPHWPEIQYVKRKRQKYIRIRIRPELITVSAPFHCSKNEMEKFLIEKTDWIDDSLLQMNAHQQQMQQIRENQKGNILLRGKWVPIDWQTEMKKREFWKLYEEDEVLKVIPPGDEDTFLPVSILQKYYRQRADIEIRERFADFSANLPFEYNRVFIRSQKTKWGTCSSKGNLSFNWRLIKCPYWIWDYLFVHELCHTVHMNHSKTYWKLVGTYFPEYKEAKAWIRENGALIFSDR